MSEKANYLSMKHASMDRAIKLKTHKKSSYNISHVWNLPVWFYLKIKCQGIHNSNIMCLSSKKGDIKKSICRRLETAVMTSSTW